MQRHRAVFKASLESLTVSQEGLFSVLKKYFRKASQKKKTKGPKQDYNELSKQELEAVLKLLKNHKAIRSLELKSGTIGGHVISQCLLGVRTQANVPELTAAVNRHLSFLEKTIKDTARNVKTQLKFMEDHAEKVASDPDPTYYLRDLVRRVGHDKIMPFRMTEAEYERNALPGTKCYYDVEMRSWSYLDDSPNSRTDELPALTHDQIIALSKVVPKVLEDLERIRSIKIGEAVLWGPFEGDRKKLAIYRQASEDQPELEALFRYETAADWGWGGAVYFLCHAVEEYAKGLLLWIYRSIDTKSADHASGSQRESVTAGLEGWFGRSKEGPGRHELNLLREMKEQGIQHRPFSPEKIESLEKDLGFNFHQSTKNFFQYIGKILHDGGEFDTFSPSEIIEHHSKVKTLSGLPAQFVPFAFESRNRPASPVSAQRLAENTCLQP